MPSIPDQKISVRGGELYIGSDVVVPYKILRNKFPEYTKALLDTDHTKKVKTLKYFPGDEDNYIELSDGSRYELPADGEIFDKICSERYVILMEHKESIVAAIAPPKDFDIMPVDVLQAPIHTRDALLKDFMIERGLPNVPSKKDWLHLTLKTCKRRLAISDWTQLLDVQENLTEEEKEFWKNYRATLRACMKDTDPYRNVVIPAVPEGSTIEND